MLAYVCLGTNDLDRSTAFYDALLAELGARRAMSTDHYAAWASAAGSPMLASIKPYDGRPATAGNGTMVTLAAASRAQVDAVYARAIELGAKDEGAPGARTKSFYGAYFRDLDGNKLCGYKIG